METAGTKQPTNQMLVVINRATDPHPLAWNLEVPNGRRLFLVIIVSPEYNTGLFLFTSLIATTKADSKQSTIMQLIFQNSIGTSETELEEEVSPGQAGPWSSGSLRTPQHAPAP